MRADLDNRELSYTINGKDQGMAFGLGNNKLPLAVYKSSWNKSLHGYRMGVMLWNKYSKIELMQYKNIDLDLDQIS